MIDGTISAILPREAAAVYSNLVDWIILKPGLGSSNNLTLLGRQYAASNITYVDNWGAHFNGSSIVLSTPCDLRTNTLVVSWRIPIADYAPNRPTQEYIAGVGSLTTGSAIWHHTSLGQYEQVWMQNGTNIWPDSNAGFTNLLNYRLIDGSYEWGHVMTHPVERRVSVISAAGVVLTAFDDGRADTWTTAQNMFLATSTIPILDPLTNVIIGAMPTNVSWNARPFTGEIDSVMVFSTAATTNLVEAATVASRCLEPETTDDIWVGDSVLSADPTWYGTNATPFWHAQRTGNNAWINGAIPGATWGTLASPAASNWLFAVPAAPGVARRLFAGCGLNDLYYWGASAAQIWPGIKTFSGWCQANNARLIMVDVMTIATNC